MTNRWRQSLYNQIHKKQNQLENLETREELTHDIVIAEERLDQLEEELDDKPIMTEEEFERFEQRIEKVEVEK